MATTGTGHRRSREAQYIDGRSRLRPVRIASRASTTTSSASSAARRGPGAPHDASPPFRFAPGHRRPRGAAGNDGDVATATRHLEWVKTSGRKEYTEYRLAIGELKRLAKQAQPKP